MNYRNKRRDELRRRIWDYKESHPCVDCKESDPVVLTFDHSDGTEKIDSVSSLVNKMVFDGYAWERILAEINKCQVRCFNCHMRRTAKQHHWYKWRNQEVKTEGEKVVESGKC